MNSSSTSHDLHNKPLTSLSLSVLLYDMGIIKPNSRVIGLNGMTFVQPKLRKILV